MHNADQIHGTALIAGTSAPSNETTTDSLRALPGVALHPVRSALGSTDNVLVMCGIAMATDSLCPVQFYLDGQPFPASDDIDRILSPHDISAIEVYTGASQVPPRFKGAPSRCGVIVFWTRDSGAAPTSP